MSRGGPRPQGGASRGGGPGGRRPGGGGRQMEDLTARMESLGGFSNDQEGNRTVHVVANHFKIQGTQPISGELEKTVKPGEFAIHQYRVSFADKDLSVPAKRAILGACKETLFQGAAYLFDGSELMFCTTMFTPGTISLTPPGEQRELSSEERSVITYTNTLAASDPKCLQIYNLIVKQCMYGVGLTPLDDNFYDADAVIEYPSLNVQLWPGYDATVKPMASGLLLSVDVIHKVIHSTDMLTSMKGLKEMHAKRRSPKTEKEFIMEELKGAQVITPYNKRNYRIDDIKYDMSPRSTFALKSGEQISFDEYYKMRYNIDIIDKDQPLVLSVVKEKFKGKTVVSEVILIPELCMLTGLTEEMRANMNVMRELTPRLHLSPSERVDLLQKFMHRLTTHPMVLEVFEKWGLTFESKLAPCVEAKILPNEDIEFANSKVFKADEKNDWTKGIRDNQMLVSVPLKRWIVIGGEKDEKLTVDFVSTMKRVARPLGFAISDPLVVEKLRDIRTNNYIRTLEELMANKYKDVQLVFCVLPNNGQDLYNAIKKRFSKDIGIPSQCIVAKTLTKNMMSVATKVVVQINSKLGGEPWRVTLPPDFQEKSMAIGFDYVGKANKTGVLVATINKSYTRYCSTTFAYKDPSQMNGNLKDGITTCAKFYFRQNKHLPETVVFFRNNVDDGRISSGEIEADAKFLEKALQDLWTDRKAGQVQLVYITVAKGSTTRLMSHTGNCDGGLKHHQVVNPPPGTYVDTDIVSSEGKFKEFFIVPSVARQGTVRAVHYRVILDTKDIPQALIGAFTYKMCHLYYNWTGTVNLPSVIQYAGKLAKQATQTMPNQTPNTQLATLLHFL